MSPDLGFRTTRGGGPRWPLYRPPFARVIKKSAVSSASRVKKQCKPKSKTAEIKAPQSDRGFLDLLSSSSRLPSTTRILSRYDSPILYAWSKSLPLNNEETKSRADFRSTAYSPTM